MLIKRVFNKFAKRDFDVGSGIIRCSKCHKPIMTKGASTGELPVNVTLLCPDCSNSEHEQPVDIVNDNT